MRTFPETSAGMTGAAKLVGQAARAAGGTMRGRGWQRVTPVTEMNTGS